MNASEEQNNKIQLVFSLVLTELATTPLARGNYSYHSNTTTKRCGFHSATATSRDLASQLWLGCEQVQPQQHEQLFHTCWQALRSHVKWNQREKNSDARLCSWLDTKSVEWHKMVVEQLVNGQEFVSRTSKTDEVDLTQEYQ